MQVTIGISNRHIHLTEEDLKTLCGDIKLEKVYDLNQPGQFASTLKLTIKTDKATIENVRVLGPTRNYTQVELSKTDAIKLGINPPLRESGDLREASPITIIGPCGVITKDCAIIATRHIHIDKVTREKLGLTNVDYVSVKVSGIKGGILNHVSIKETNPAYYEMHLDTDDANAHFLTSESIGEIILEEE